MNKEQVTNIVESIFKDIFDDEDLQITSETNAGDIAEWDSLEQINLIVAFENEFKVKFTLEEVNVLKNVGEMIDLIFRKLSNE